jgi:hypothetical protein
VVWAERMLNEKAKTKRVRNFKPHDGWMSKLTPKNRAVEYPNVSYLE